MGTTIVLTIMFFLAVILLLVGLLLFAKAKLSPSGDASDMPGTTPASTDCLLGRPNIRCSHPPPVLCGSSGDLVFWTFGFMLFFIVF